MALIDHSDVFIGSTGDGWTFVVLNRPIRNASRILTGAGFTAREHQGRTLHLLPPETAEDAHERAGVAAYGLLAHTMDFVDLAWTTRQRGAIPAAQPDVSFRFTDHAVTATAATDRARAILARHRFTPSADGSLYVLAAGLSERAVVSSVVQTEAHLHADGISVRIDLGIATLQDIPPAPPRPGAAPSPPSTTPVKRRSR
ncbi:hypothetical protein GCM10019016_078300 [Streptomyces prasinosporus]|uniref:Uncharacterized protein n=2 Tax=Streptomyces TaxID=1883 RepID=A0ABP6U1B1_9ACTN|nr:hypothetical protein [Streptomyces tricolor]MCG0061834.1 hypothetical protein [Streptomyces tricolor]GHB93623.1 hypothetical protein GCM10010332_19470 [Streptomyces albogriseolus]